MTPDDRRRANQQAVANITLAQPVLVDVQPAGEVVPGFTPDLILTAGAPLPWTVYRGGQRRAILGAAMMQGLAANAEEADRKLADGSIRLAACHDFGCVGSVTGVYYASAPVLVVRNSRGGNEAFCSVYEGSARERLVYGVYNQRVRDNLEFVRLEVAPALGQALRDAGGLDLAAITRRALRMGDELHSRNTAASLLLLGQMLPHLLRRTHPGADNAARFMAENQLFFLHVAMAAAKAAADSARDIPGSSIVTAITSSAAEMAIRVSGLGDQWFRAPRPPLRAKLFDGYTEADMGDMGGESFITEATGLGAFAAAAAPALSDYSGGTPEAMTAQTLQMYDITVTEHPHYRIPSLRRGTPVGIDVFKVLSTGIRPVLHSGAAHREGGHIGAGVFEVPLECFTAAAAAYRQQYPQATDDA